MRPLPFLLALALAGCVPTSIPSTPAPALAAVAAELGLPGTRTLRLREGTFDGLACDLRIYDAVADADGLRFGAVEFPGQRDAGLTVEGAGGRPAVGDTLAVTVQGTACAPRLRYGTRPVGGSGRVLVLAGEGGAVSGALVADLSPSGGSAGRAARSVRVLGTFTLAPPDTLLR